MNLLRRMILAAGPWLLLPRLVRAAEPGSEAGTIQVADGQVRVRNATGAERQPAVGGKLFEGDTVSTGADGELHAEMVDGGVIGLRSGTSLTLTTYKASGEASDGAVFQLIRGGFRSITGWIAKSTPSNYKIVTGTATIGVRGTDHEPHVIEPGSSEGEPGLYDQVHAGGTYIQGPSGRVDVAQGKVGFFSPTAKTAPRILAATPAFFRGGKHEDRFQGLHDRVSRSLDTQRATRVKQIREQRQQMPGRASTGVQQPHQGAGVHPGLPGHVAPGGQGVRAGQMPHPGQNLHPGQMQAQRPVIQPHAPALQNRQPVTRHPEHKN